MSVMARAPAIGGYVFTRAFSTFIDRHDVGNWSEMLGLVALLVEGWLVLLSFWTGLAPGRPRSPAATSTAPGT